MRRPIAYRGAGAGPHSRRQPQGHVADYRGGHLGDAHPEGRLDRQHLSLAATSGATQMGYEVSKAAVNRLTTLVALFIARYGIRATPS